MHSEKALMSTALSLNDQRLDPTCHPEAFRQTRDNAPFASSGVASPPSIDKKIWHPRPRRRKSMAPHVNTLKRGTPEAATGTCGSSNPGFASTRALQVCVVELDLIATN